MNMLKSDTPKTALLAALLVFATSSGRADPASGDYNVSFEGNPNVWDISGTYKEDLDGLSTDYTINLDSSGKFNGVGTARFYDEPDYMEGALSLNGSLRSAGNVVRVSVTLKMNLSGQAQGYAATVTATVKENLELDPVSRQLVGTASGKATVSVPGVGKQSASLPKMEISNAIPSDATGSWELALNLSSNLNKYTGTSTVTLSNGRSFPLLATGSYAAKTDASKITLKGIDLNQAIRMSMTAYCTNGQMTVRKLTGKALGQNLQLTTGL